jgi:hypothetical protein
VSELEAGIYDTGGSLCTSIAGMDVLYGFSVDPKGRISGIADVTVVGDGSCTGGIDASAPLKGKLSGKKGRLRLRMNAKAESTTPGADAKVKVQLREDTQTTTGVLTRTQKAKGQRLGQKVSDTTSTTTCLNGSSGPDCLTGAPLGWRLDFTLPGSGSEVTDAALTLQDGRTIPLRANGTFKFDVNSSNLRFKSEGADKGIRIRLQKFRVDQVTGDITRGQLSFRILGQKGALELD